MLILVLLNFAYIIIAGEYQVRVGTIPSFLRHRFYETTDDVFPSDIAVNVSFTRDEGTLLYTVDKRENQLIVSVLGKQEEKLKIEFQGKEDYFVLAEHCGCQYARCKYIPLMLRFYINDFLNIECNGLKSMKIKYEKRISTNQLISDYPIIQKSDNWAAEIWLVNIPENHYSLPNRDQLTGCIFDVLYKGQSLDLVKYGDAIVDTKNCKRMCNNNACNDGTCYETYENKPICDCENSFMNGDHCNTTGFTKKFVNELVVSQKLLFNVMKITWFSNSSKIFNINNGKISIRLFSDLHELKINFQHQTDVSHSSKTVTITKNYNSQFISKLIMYLEDGYSKFNISNGIFNYDLNLQTTVDLSKETFTSMNLLNGCGQIDVVYKSSDTKYKWNMVKLEQFSPDHKKDCLQKSEHLRGSSLKNKAEQIIIIVAVLQLFFLLLSF